MKVMIRRIQEAVGAKPDGVFGENTARAVLEALKKKGL